MTYDTKAALLVALRRPYRQHGKSRLWYNRCLVIKHDSLAESMLCHCCGSQKHASDMSGLWLLLSLAGWCRGHKRVLTAPCCCRTELIVSKQKWRDSIGR